jgi:hypothetical protein
VDAGEVGSFAEAGPVVPGFQQDGEDFSWGKFHDECL